MVFTEFIFTFPRLYVTVRLFGREFNLDLGWFMAGDGVHEWKFGPSLTVAKLEWAQATTYYCSLEFFAFTRHLLISLGTTRYDD